MSLRPLLPAALCAFGLLSLSGLDRPAVSQDGETPAAAEFQPTTVGARDGIDVYPRRLPPGLGVLRLSQEQKERIYAVQAKYHVQIEALREQIAELEAQQEAEVTAALTPAQKEFLKAYEAMKKAEAAANAEADAADAATADAE
ncbi:hypothetical protein [Alienimonas sp. DA493]|uniref:hypothetical protein n=1 Tax=Alienimonas sp. DA493 TaxID=3373605 RepID=UPI0037550A54